MQDKEVSWMPAYGPEMRGGTANVTVIISDDRVSSPILHDFDTAIILNQQSLDKFEGAVKKGGVLLFDPNGITHPPTRTDINIYSIEAVEESAKLGNPKTFNMIVLGAYLKIKPIVLPDNVKKGLENSLPKRHHKLIPMNEEAIGVGTKNLETVLEV
jgi:2-oxoglutarate ferredoxin oxidoreductase subunit gamma